MSGNLADAKAAKAILQAEEAALIVAVIITPVLIDDIRRLRCGDPSVSNALGFFWDRYPKTCWSIWIGLGLHFGTRLRDPLDRLGRWIRGLRTNS